MAAGQFGSPRWAPNGSALVASAGTELRTIALSGDQRTVLTVSAGNHGQAIARAASTFKLPCIVVVPTTAPKTKIEAIRQYGVDLRLEGSNYDQAEEWTLRLAGNTNLQRRLYLGEVLVSIDNSTGMFMRLSQLLPHRHSLAPVTGSDLPKRHGGDAPEYRIETDPK